MTVRNACVDAVMDELSRYGLRGELLARAKHQEVVWLLPNGKRESHTVPTTPSDNRAWLNTRGEVRRKLRTAGLELPQKGNVLTLKHALSTPNLKTPEPHADRIKRLEDDRDVLLDWLVDARVLVDQVVVDVATMRAQLASVRVTVSFDNNSAQPFVPAEAPPRSMGRPRSEATQEQKVLSVLTGAWKDLSQIAAESGVPHVRLNRVTWTLKRAGLVENGQRGYWRRKPGLDLAQTG